MATTTVRLDPEEEQTLDSLAELHGGRSNALRKGLKLLAAQTERQIALTELLREWDEELGGVDQQAVDAMAARFNL